MVESYVGQCKYEWAHTECAFFSPSWAGKQEPHLACEFGGLCPVKGGQKQEIKALPTQLFAYLSVSQIT